MSSDFSIDEGSLVEIDVINKSNSEEGLLLIYLPTEDINKCRIYEEIDLDTFPSYRDFKGNYSIVKHGDICTVLKKIGRPYKIKCSSKWNAYDVYEVMTETSEIRQIFKHNLKPIENKKV